MDGVKLRIQQASTTEQHALFYNGWKHDNFLTAVMCFFPDGTIVMTIFMSQVHKVTAQFVN